MITYLLTSHTHPTFNSCHSAHSVPRLLSNPKQTQYFLKRDGSLFSLVWFPLLIFSVIIFELHVDSETKWSISICSRIFLATFLPFYTNQKVILQEWQHFFSSPKEQDHILELQGISPHSTVFHNRAILGCPGTPIKQSWRTAPHCLHTPVSGARNYCSLETLTFTFIFLVCAQTHY